MRLIILAAGQGTRLKPLTDKHPKCLTHLADKTLLDWQIETANAAGIYDICVVGGYKMSQLKKYEVQLIENKLYRTTNMVYSLFCAKDFLDKTVVVSYGDIVYSQEVLEKVIQARDPISVVVDLDWNNYWNKRFEDPLKDAESLTYNSLGKITSIGKKAHSISEIQGQYIGLMCFNHEGLTIIKEHYEFLKTTSPDRILNMYMTDFLQSLIDAEYCAKMVPIHGNWLEIDSLHDLKIAEQLIAERV